MDTVCLHSSVLNVFILIDYIQFQGFCNWLNAISKLIYENTPAL